MLIDNQHPDNKSIVASVLGVPNAGKSSMINYLLGMDLSIVTNKAQTTRNKFNCILTVDRTEIVLVDTPGLHKSGQEFNKRLNEQARESVDGTDVNLILVDLSGDVLEQLKQIKEIIGKELGRSWLLFTKVDLFSNWEEMPLDKVFDAAKTLIPSLEKFMAISSVDETNMNNLIGELCDAAVEGPHLYPGGEISNRNQRFFVTEYIREQAFNLLKDEIPYEVAVVIEEYKDIIDKNTKDVVKSNISASILVNRPSQRAIVIGSKGSMIKEIGVRSRKKIEAMTGAKVNLNLHVKVSPKWFKNNFVLEEIGLPRATDSSRVWHAR